MTLIKLKKIIENFLFDYEKKLKINSNDILNGDVFIALQGINTHGNDYVKQALNKGARYIITDKKSDLFANKINVLFVKNSLNFLLKIANKKRNSFKGKIIGITGSAGKTSVKENLKYFISPELNVSASIKSYNNFLGVLISLINMDLFCDFAIFEIGTNNFNEIKILTSIIKPQQVIITNIFPTHLENLRNTRNVAKEKSDIFNPKYNSEVELLILPNSNIDESFLCDQAQNMKVSKIITLGKNANSNYCIQKIDKTYNKISAVEVKTNKKLFKIDLNTNLYHQIHNIIICFIIFQYNHLPFKQFYEKAIKVPKVEGRGQDIKVIIDNKEVRIIDESYNASPATMKICINYFDKLELKKNQKKFLILGDMNELGVTSKKYHKQIVDQILDCNFKNVILCGKLFKAALNNFITKTDEIKYMSNENEIIQFLKEKIHNNDTILIKGSNSTKVNKLAKILITNRR